MERYRVHHLLAHPRCSVTWVLAFAGMTLVRARRLTGTVIPAKRSAERDSSCEEGACGWIPDSLVRLGFGDDGLRHMGGRAG